MQHDGWLETYLHTRFPKHDLVFRNLGFSGDETDRSRAAAPPSFGSARRVADQASKADVVFAFFGYNESFAGKAGLDKFKKDLDAFVKHTLAQKYNGKSAAAARAVLADRPRGPRRTPNLPDGTANNDRLELYTAAMAEVAKANDVPFVDLFHPTQDLYAKATKPLTINGIHLTRSGQPSCVAKDHRHGALRRRRRRATTSRSDKVRQAVARQELPLVQPLPHRPTATRSTAAGPT